MINTTVFHTILLRNHLFYSQLSLSFIDIDLYSAQTRRDTYKELIEERFDKIEECEKNQKTARACNCSEMLEKITETFKEIKTFDQQILERIEIEKIKEEIKQASNYDDTMELKIKVFNERVKLHVANIVGQKKKSRMDDLRSKRQEGNNMVMVK